VHVFDELISQAKTVRRVNSNLGDHTFIYEGAQAHDDPQSTVWKFSVYRGLEMADGDQTSCTVVAFTKPRI